LLGGFGLLAALAFCPWIAGGGTSPKWAVLAIAPWLLIDDTTPKLSKQTLLLLALVAWCALTIAWAPNKYDAFGELFQLAIAAGVYLLGSTVRDGKPYYLGFAIGVVLATPLEWFDIHIFGSNSDILGEAAAVAIIGCICVEAFGLALFNTIPLIVSGSRGAWLGLAGCLIVSGAVRLSWRKRIFVCALSAATIAGLVVLGSHASIIERLNIWQDTLAGLTFWGHGLGSYWDMFPHFASRIDVLAQTQTRPDHAHNDLLELIFETGAIGGLLALAIVATVFSSSSPERYIVICVFIMAFVGFSLHLPATLGMAAFALGRINRSSDLQRRVVAGRIPSKHLPMEPSF
jgi:O-antigen ligase